MVVALVSTAWWEPIYYTLTALLNTQDTINGMEYAIVSGNIHGELASTTKVILVADHCIFDEGHTELALVLQGFSGQGWEVLLDIIFGESAGDNVHLDNFSSDWLRSFLESRISRGKNSERPRTRELVGNTSGLEVVHEGAKVIVALQVILLVTKGYTLGAPADARALKGCQSVHTVGEQRRLDPLVLRNHEGADKSHKGEDGEDAQGKHR
mmetsp:Transcript_42841/g.69939  ORF Transcript_42841/g.69939 Transcript_42841/m.69939 type:complete len:211 (+) Transcript_42841:275-907(+)